MSVDVCQTLDFAMEAVTVEGMKSPPAAKDGLAVLTRHASRLLVTNNVLGNVATGASARMTLFVCAAMLLMAVAVGVSSSAVRTINGTTTSPD